MATMRISKVKSDKFNVVDICTSGNSGEKYITRMKSLKYSLFSSVYALKKIGDVSAFQNFLFYYYYWY
jgi:hypothetical protein